MNLLLRASLPLACAALAACAGRPAPPVASPHGTMSNLSVARPGEQFCAHKVPSESCVKCHPELAAKFKAAGDWCAEHDVPESQCLICHPDLSFAPIPEPPPGADVARLSEHGEEVPALEAHAVRGKVTLFDFYADWCAPCRDVDRHVFAMLGTRGDLAVRKLNMVSWETPIARRHLASVKSLPYVVVYGRDGKRRGEVSGLDLAALDRLIEEAARR